MFYLVQDSNEKGFPLLLEAMDKMDIKYEICKYIPFVGEIVFKTKRKDVFCFGAYNLTGVSDKYGFNPGQVSNKNHNYEIYAPNFGYENMLNGDGLVIEFTEKPPKDSIYDEFFARPTIDEKIFAGQIFKREEWNEYVKN